MLNRIKAALFNKAVPAMTNEPFPTAVEELARVTTQTIASTDFVIPRDGLPLERLFSQLGFTAMPQVFSYEDAISIRHAAIGLFPENKSPYSPAFSLTALFHEPFRAIFQNAKLIDGLRRILGDDFVFINEFSVQDSNFAGWHTDTSSPDGKAGKDFHWNPNFRVVNIAIYLQDNLDNGGGIDLVPRSFIHDDPLAKIIRREKGLSLVDFEVEDELDPYGYAKTIRTKLGDVVMFHLRSRHRSSLVKRAALNDEDRKLAIFLIAGPNNMETHLFRAWLDEYDVMNGATRPIVPEEFRAFLAAEKLSII